jgi:phosphatidylinositol alpha-1,6-mannosyltransferase
MPRKGQDMLVRALPAIQRRVPGTALVLVGGGPSRRRLEKLAREHDVTGDVLFTGSVDHESLPTWYGVGDVFAMPCRERLGGIDVEGLGMVFLEAAACERPVVAGRSGGSVDAVLDGETGRLVDGRSVDGISSTVSDLLLDRKRAVEMGRRGRAWVDSVWSWQSTVGALQGMLKDPS